MKFKVGDRVQFKTWEEMEKEYGTNNNGMIECLLGFPTGMKHLCGTFATIDKIDGTFVILKDFTADGNTIMWGYSEDMLKPAAEQQTKYELHIISDGKTTNAVYKKNGKVIARSQARKHPDDEFNFETGAFMAADRIFHTEKKDSKPELYLYNTFNEKHYGVVGKQTNFKDKNGRPLFVGDTVELVDIFSKNKYTSIMVNQHGEDFVYGIQIACDQDGGAFHGWDVTLLKPYTQIKPGDKVGDIIVKVK